MLTGKLICLSSLTKEDLSAVNYLRNDWELKKLTLGIRFPIILESDVAWFNHISSDMTNKNVFFAIRFVQDNSFVGLLQINNIDWINRNALIGIQLLPNAQGKGIGKEAITLASSYCFNKINLNKITAHIAAYNTGSLNLFEKCGFILEGILIRQIYYDNSYADLKIYSLFKN